MYLGAESFSLGLTSDPEKIGIVVAILIWSLIWKGLALWKAGRLGEKRWFIAILVINTIGLLEIIYLFTQNKKKLRTILIILLAVFVTIAVVALSGGNVVQIKS